MKLHVHFMPVSTLHTYHTLPAPQQQQVSWYCQNYRGFNFLGFWIHLQQKIAKLHTLNLPCMSVYPFVTPLQLLNIFSWTLMIKL